MIKRLLGGLALWCALAAMAGAQNTTTFGNIVSQGAPCGSSNCVYYELPPGTPWVTVTVTGTWAGTLEMATTSAANANYSNLSTLSWTVLATETANGSWSASTGGATYLRVRAPIWTSGMAQVAMASAAAAGANPVYPGVLTAGGGIVAQGAGVTFPDGTTQASAGTLAGWTVTGSGSSQVVTSPGSFLAPFIGGVSYSSSPSSQYASLPATATCLVNTSGTLSILPYSTGNGYTSAPTVTVSNTTTGIVGTITAVLTGSSVTSYTLSSSSGFQNVNPVFNGNNGCPITISVAAPPTPATPVANINASLGVTALQPQIRPEDFGAWGDGVHDDTIALNNWMQYAASTGAPGVALTQGNTYLIGSFTSQHQAGGDTGVAPHAATLSCTASSGVVSGCSITDGGYGLTTTGAALVHLASGTAGSGATIKVGLTACNTTACPTSSVGSYASSVTTASGGTLYPNTFTAYMGPVCDGTPCAQLAPSWSYVGDSLQVPSNLKIDGNGATLLSGYSGSAVSASSYTTSYPYGVMAQMGTGSSIFNVTVKNAFIAFAPSAYNIFDRIIFSGVGCAFQEANSQYNTYSNITTPNTYNYCGWFLGGQSVDRSPTYGLTASSIANGADLADSTTIHDVVYYENTAQTTGTAFTARRQAFDCWFDMNIVHLEDSGVTNSDACYVPTGFVNALGNQQRITDDDAAALSPIDRQWRGAFGMGISATAVYGRPMSYILVKNVNFKGNTNYDLNTNSNIGLLLDNVADEQAGLCECPAGGCPTTLPSSGAASWGATGICANPYEPLNVQRPSPILIGASSASESGTDSITNVDGTNAACTVSQPWSQATSTSATNFSPVPQGLGAEYCVNQTQNASPIPFGSRQATVFFAGSIANYNSANADSADAMWQGISYNGSSPRSDYWRMGVRNGALYTAPHSLYDAQILEISASLNGTAPTAGSAYFKAPGLVADPAPAQGGNVTALTLATAGSGYAPASQIGCSMTPAPMELPGTSLGSNLISSGDTWSVGANWTGSTWPFTHSAGSTAAITDTTFTPTIGNYYIVSFVASGLTDGSGTLTVTMGGGTQTVASRNGTTYQLRFFATSTAQLTFTPTSGFIGTVGTMTVNSLASTLLYQATCSASSNMAGQISSVILAYPALGYTSAPTVTIASPTSGTTATATAAVNGLKDPGGNITSYNPIGHDVLSATYLPTSGTIAAFSSTTITGVTCVGALTGSYSSGDAVNVIAPGGAWSTVPTLQVTAWVTASSTCSMHLYNPTATSITYADGPWIFEPKGLGAGGPPIYTPVSSSAVVTTDSTSQAPGSPSMGGTGQDDHTATGVGQWLAGVYTPSTALANGTTATTQSVSDNTTKVATDAFVRAQLPLTGTTGTITGTALTATCDSGTASVTGAVVGAPVVVSSTTGADVGGAFNVRGSVTATGTVTVYVCGTGTPASLAYNVRVIQ